MLKDAGNALVGRVERIGNKNEPSRDIVLAKAPGVVFRTMCPSASVKRYEPPEERLPPMYSAI